MKPIPSLADCPKNRIGRRALTQTPPDPVKGKLDGCERSIRSGCYGFMRAGKRCRVFSLAWISGGVIRNVVAGSMLSVGVANEDFLSGFPESKSDGNLTSAVFISWSDVITAEESTLQKNLFIEHMAYTPSGENKYKKYFVEDDRRFAGWTGIGLGFTRKERTEHPARNQITELNFVLGATGPVSGAEVFQNSMHAIRNLPEFKGWEFQLPNKVGFMFRYAQYRQYIMPFYIPGSDFECFHGFGVKAGTIHTGAFYTFNLRVGRGLAEDSGPVRVEEHHVALPARNMGKGWTYAVFAGIQTGLQIYHHHFDTDSSGPFLKKYPLVSDVHLGGQIGFDRYVLTVSASLHSREFETQRDNHLLYRAMISFNY